MDPRGRCCALAYRYQPEALAQPAQLWADTLYVVGGLYGNLASLHAVLERADHEPDGPATIVFNGDFHWLDTDPEDFPAISQTVLAILRSRATSRPSLPPRRTPGAAAPTPTTSTMRSSSAPTRS